MWRTVCEKKGGRCTQEVNRREYLVDSGASLRKMGQHICPEERRITRPTEIAYSIANRKRHSGVSREADAFLDQRHGHLRLHQVGGGFGRVGNTGKVLQ